MTRVLIGFLALLLASGLALFASKERTQKDTAKSASLEMCRCEDHGSSSGTTTPAHAQNVAREQPRHPLRGVIVDIALNDSALIVKHEEIVGFMKAMTMRLKVDPQVLPRAKKGGAVTGQLVRRAEEWWLEDIVFTDANRT